MSISKVVANCRKGRGEGKGLSIMTDYFSTGKTISGVYHATELLYLREAIKSKCHRKLSQGVLCLQDHVSSHNSLVAVPSEPNGSLCGFYNDWKTNLIMKPQENTSSPSERGKDFKSCSLLVLSTAV